MRLARQIAERKKYQQRLENAKVYAKGERVRFENHVEQMELDIIWGLSAQFLIDQEDAEEIWEDTA